MSAQCRHSPCRFHTMYSSACSLTERQQLDAFCGAAHERKTCWPRPHCRRACRSTFSATRLPSTSHRSSRARLGKPATTSSQDRRLHADVLPGVMADEGQTWKPATRPGPPWSAVCRTAATAFPMPAKNVASGTMGNSRSHGTMEGKGSAIDCRSPMINGGVPATIASKRRLEV